MIQTMTRRIIIAVGLILCLTFQAKADTVKDLAREGIDLPITRSIMLLQPSLTKQEALYHANHIYRAYLQTGMDWKLLVSITFQESGFRVFRGDRSCGYTIDKNKLTCIYRSFGPMHVHVDYWDNKFDFPDDGYELIYNPAKGYEYGSWILKIFHDKYARKDPYWLGRYNSSTEKHKMSYYYRVMNHFARIEKHLDKLRNK